MTIRGIQEAQRKNLEIIQALKPNGALGRAVQYGTVQAHRYSVSITHVDTGALRASERVRVYGLRGVVYLDETARNPKSRQRTAIYGVVEHNRGGSHAFFERTHNEAGGRIAQAAGAGFMRELP
jgi:hypothetical protein